MRRASGAHEVSRWLGARRPASAFVIAVAAAASLAFAAPASAVTTFAWGENRLGQLGVEPLGGTTVPIVDGEAGEVAALSAGGRNSLALLKNGTVEGWGSNGFGELGNGEEEKIQVEPVLAAGLNEVAQVSAGHKFSLALLNNGTVMAWGDNKYGQLGTGSMEFANTPEPVAGLSGVKEVDAGFFHSIALLENGTVAAWGNGKYGQLGNGATEDSDVPVPVPGLKNVVQVGAGCIDSIALLSDGTVVSFGGNEYGQLGHGGKLTKRSSVPEPVVGLHEVKAIAAGLFYNLALLKNGTVMGWGYNISGQLGNGTTSIISGTPTPVSGLSGVTTLAAAGGSMSVPRTSQHSLALTEGGAVYGWGGNEFGQVGDGTLVAKLVPVPVVGLSSGVKAIASGGFHSLALR
jgi:alpha-tubulin suppressor-like RCC1 family protein